MKAYGRAEQLRSMAAYLAAKFIEESLMKRPPSGQLLAHLT
jgi:hypothetical protein